MIRAEKSREAKDRRILRLGAASFCVLVPAFVALSFSGSQSAGISELISGVLGGLAFSFFATGFLVFRYYGRGGLTRRRALWKWVLLGAFGLAFLLVLVVVVAATLLPPPPGVESLPFNQLALVVPILLAALFPAAVLFVLGAWVLGMGVVGTMSAVSRRVAPWVLNELRSSDPGQPLPFLRRALRWLFAIPDVLDPGTLSVSLREPRRDVRRSDLKPAVVWQVFFGAILAVYVSLNPFVADGSPTTVLRIFGILTTGSILIPFLVLPWFLYAALGARIRGVVKDFTLFSGIKARILRSYLALGTVVIFVRWSLARVSVESYLVWFLLFLTALSVTAVSFSFLYLNYFENDLVADVLRSFEAMRDGAPDRGGAGPGR